MAKRKPQQAVPTTKYPEVGFFKEPKALRKYYKSLSDAEVQEWVDLEGLTYKACPTSQPIHRMRMCMAVLYKHFPAEAPQPKAKSKYADYTTEQLIAMAADKSVPVEVTDDMKILRMRTIMALRAHGHIQ